MRVSEGGRSLLTSLLLLLLLLLSPGETCGPGRGSGRRRRPKKLTPLVFKQHVPNVSENSLGASGLADGAIRRGDARFKDLVRNNNPDIIFKDEEGTGADRIMSQRCKDKLNTLAISVLNQWPGVKLRVTEAWDEDGMHADNSLHYEGRAVDISTSDRDRSKYGMLARLAVEAGFDWVYYETRGQIHCSVKSDSSIAINFGGCFPAASTVITSTGQIKPMTELQIGERVLSTTQDGRLEFSDVIAFLDISHEKVVNYYTLTTQSGYSITLTGKHLMYTTNMTHTSEMTSIYSIQSRLTFAEDVLIGQFIILAKDITPPAENIQGLRISVTTNSSNYFSPMNIEFPTDKVLFYKTLIPQKVVSIKLHSIRGVYAPLTLAGTIVVDNFVASCYACIQDQSLAHAAFAPLRRFYVIKTFLIDWLGHFVHYFDWMNMISCFCDTNRNETDLQHRGDGTHLYAWLLYKFAINIIGMDIQISV